MSQIRKKSIKATSWIYLGIAIGALNTYFLTHKIWFTTDENGLTRALIEISQLVFAFSSFGVTSYLAKFFPYYKDHTEPQQNDLLGMALIIGISGFLITCTGLYLLQDVIIRKFNTNAHLLVQYFYWTLPFGLMVLLYNMLEAYAQGFQKGVLTTLLKETVVRIYILALILLRVFNYISFDQFAKLFAFQYALIVIILAVMLAKEKKLWICFRFSRVTLKYRKKIIAILTLTFIVIIVNVLRSSIDGLVLAAKQNLGKVGIFGLAAYMATVLQAPMRSIISVTIPLLSRAWKDKNHSEIERIYKRSSINLLSFSLFAFFLIWLNFSEAIHVLNINPDYLQGKWVFFILGIVTIIEMGTGVNAHIIATSVYWRFELWTSILLTVLIIPLSYYLTVTLGIMGPAIANLISYSIYNSIRYSFLLRKFRFQPFYIKTAEVIVIAIFSYLPAYFASIYFNGWPSIISSSIIYCSLFISLAWWREISPDMKPVALALRNRILGNTKGQEE